MLRELRENSPDFALFVDLQRTDAVVRFQRSQRLDENRLPAGAGVVHDSGHIGGELGLDGDHKAAIADRNDRILDLSLIHISNGVRATSSPFCSADVISSMIKSTISVAWRFESSDSLATESTISAFVKFSSLLMRH